MLDSRFKEAWAIIAFISSFVDDKAAEPHGLGDSDGSTSLDKLALAASCRFRAGLGELPNILVDFCGVARALSGADKRALPLESNQMLSTDKLDGVSVW